MSRLTAKPHLPEASAAGVAWFDYDNDTRLDIFLRKGGFEHWHRLFHRQTEESLEDVTERARLEGVGYG